MGSRPPPPLSSRDPTSTPLPAPHAHHTPARTVEALAVPTLLSQQYVPAAPAVPERRGDAQDPHRPQHRTPPRSSLAARAGDRQPAHGEDEQAEAGGGARRSAEARSRDEVPPRPSTLGSHSLEKRPRTRERPRSDAQAAGMQKRQWQIPQAEGCAFLFLSFHPHPSVPLLTVSRSRACDYQIRSATTST